MPLLLRNLFSLGKSFAWLGLRESVIRLQTANEVGLAQELRLLPTDLAVFNSTQPSCYMASYTKC